MPDMPSNGGKAVRAALRVEPNFATFADREIPDHCLEHLIELARLAPSEWNFQPWRWIVVRSNPGRQQLEASTYITVPLSSAPAVLICLADTLAWKTAPQHLQEMVTSKKMTEGEAREALCKIREYYSSSPEVAQRTALANAFVALHQMLIAAADCDLSAFWVTEIDEPLVKTYFHIPDQFLVAALLALGYRERAVPAPVPKLPLHSLVYKEKFGETFEDSYQGPASEAHAR